MHWDQSTLFAYGALLLVVVAAFARAFLAWRRRELRARVLEVLSRASARGRPLLPLLACAIQEQRGRNRRALRRVHAALTQGESLASALCRAGRRYFPARIVARVRAAEGTAGLPRALAAAANEVERSLETRHRLLLLCLYPAVLIAVLAFTHTTSVARIGEIHDAVSSEGRARLAHELGNWLTQRTLWVAAAGLAVWLGLRRLRLLPGARLERAGRLLGTLAPLVSSGVALPDALRRAGASVVADRLEVGAGIEEAFGALRLPRGVAMRVAAARNRDEVGFGNALAALSEECARRHQARLAATLRWAQPVAILVIAVLAALQFGSLIELEISLTREMCPW